MEISINPDKNLSLVPLSESDHQKLTELIRPIYKSAYQDFWQDLGDWYLDLNYSFENLSKELSSIQSHYFFVLHEGESIGILKYDFPASPKEIRIPNALKLHRLYLHSSVHGKGIAQEILEYVENVALENKLEEIWLEAMDKKPQALRFYSKLGFEKVYSYQLTFELMKPNMRGIQIMKKVIGTPLEIKN